MPLHVRAGAIIPHAPVRQYVDQPSDEPLSVVVYPGADGAFVLYEDDGRTFAYRKGAFMRIAMAWDDRARRLSMRLAPGSRMLAPMARPMRVRVAGSKEEKSVTFDGRPLAVTLSPSA
jgi:alpha-glucosidase (family GH31 glycosyl hydrolase)